jgi:adenosylhomocysteine nucleosidase
MQRSLFSRGPFGLLVCALLLAPVAWGRPLIALCGAYEPEIVAIKKEFGIDPAKGWKRATAGSVEFWTGTFAGKDVIVFSTGISMVNAASRLQLALDRFPITQVLFAGVAGGTDPALTVGDVVIPAQWAYHSEAAYLNEDGHGGYVRPDYLPPGKANFGMMFPTGTEVSDAEGKLERLELMPVDASLLAIARQAVPGLAPMKQLGRTVRVEVGGTGVTGPVFLDNAPYREWIFKTWQARCVDMESTAIVHVAHTNAKPVLVVRALSDLAGGQHGKNPIEQNELSVSEIAAHVLRAIVEKM